jgi:CoA-transferase family III
MNPALQIPLTGAADRMLEALSAATASSAIRALRGGTLLGERAMLRGMPVPSFTSANRTCHLLAAVGDWVAINLARPSDVEMLPALFECDEFVGVDSGSLAVHTRTADAVELTARGRLLGLAVARVHERHVETDPVANCAESVLIRSEQLANVRSRTPAVPPIRTAPRVLDLSALWAGPLATHLLWLAGADVIRVEHRRRPDPMRQSDSGFFNLLNQGKSSVVLDLDGADDQHALLQLIAASDIVVEAARPRALLQLGIDAAAQVGRYPGLVWITITGHGASGEAAGWIGFGDDCGVAGGLSAALRDATGHTGFVGDAIADPLTGIASALTAWTQWQSGSGGRWGLAMSDVVNQCLRMERGHDRDAWVKILNVWASAKGQSFPVVERRTIRAPTASLGADTHHCLSRVAIRATD